MAQREDKVSISIRLDPGVHQQLVKAAAKAKTPLNGEIQRRLSLSFEAESQPDLAPQLTRIEHTVNAIASSLLARRAE